MTAYNNSQGGERAQGAADGRPADFKLFRQLNFRRKLGFRGVFTTSNSVNKDLLYLLREWLVTNRDLLGVHLMSRK